MSRTVPKKLPGRLVLGARYDHNIIILLWLHIIPRNGTKYLKVTVLIFGVAHGCLLVVFFLKKNNLHIKKIFKKKERKEKEMMSSM